MNEKAKKVQTNEDIASLYKQYSEQLRKDDGSINKSAIIRALDSKGFKKGPISRIMQIRYQFVRNVLITPLKKA